MTTVTLSAHNQTVSIDSDEDVAKWLASHERYFMDGDILVFPDRMRAFVTTTVLYEFTLDEFSAATGLARDSMELTRAWGSFMHIGQRLPFAEWWARHQGEYA